MRGVGALLRQLNTPIPPPLLPTDLILQRWAVEQGTGLASEVWDDRPQAKLPALDPRTFGLVERFVASLVPSRRDLVRAVYIRCKLLNDEGKARVLGYTLTEYKFARDGALEDLRMRFEASGDATLARLLAVRLAL